MIVCPRRPTWIAGFSDNIAIIVHGHCLAYLLVLTILSSAVARNGVSRIVDLGPLTDWSASQIGVLILSLLMVSTRMRLTTWRTTWFSIDEIVVSICVDFECIESNVVPCVLLLLMLLQCLPLPVRIVPRIQYVVPTTRQSGLSYFVLLPPDFFSLLCALLVLLHRLPPFHVSVVCLLPLMIQDLLLLCILLSLTVLFCRSKVSLVVLFRLEVIIGAWDGDLLMHLGSLPLVHSKSHLSIPINLHSQTSIISQLSYNRIEEKRG